ncbi:Nramp family divalent metal transporter [uncultured Clostridium sp.]|jgi:NRAMP (natural resistance-associated macrophage protein)-like metal ion transporter|uniref:Nramp family divalent metal transporter n=1 Tax=uncultured Clostridium sp. TaxID=59620 RepID=UPI00260B6C87|nr:Nramp family divalent metal transporter [uncultured Clostridium sp.]
MNNNSSVLMKKDKKKFNFKKLSLLFATFGPGMIVMLADTDAGSIVTAAQSGAQWGYRLLLLQIILIPILYFVQELTNRLGVVTGKGHGELIRDIFGKHWEVFSVITLFVAVVGALVTEFTGILGVGILFGVSKWVSVPLAAVGLILITILGKYKRIEKIAIFVGLFELVFIVIAIMSHPSPSEILAGMGQQEFAKASYWLIISANVGAVIMPWMIFYQQSAVVDKKVDESYIKTSRIDTLIGSVITQVIMAAVLIAVAATIGKTNPNAPLNSVQEIVHAITPFVGENAGKILFGVGMIGAALIAAIVVSLAISWSLGEMLNVPSSLDNTWKEAPVFYSIYIAVIVLSAAVVLSGLPLINLTLAVEILNSLLLPIVLGFLIALGFKALPEKHALKKWEKIVLITIYVATCTLGVITAASIFV